jgi:hypothetical protein
MLAHLEVRVVVRIRSGRVELWYFDSDIGDIHTRSGRT